MLSNIRRRFNATSFVVVLALLFAMSGGAYAAGKYLITSTKQISPRVLKSLQGKIGPAGAAGAQGPVGAAGAQGPAGGPGKEGPAGKEGPIGKEGPTGKNGTNGKEGSPWTAGGTLPEEQTLEGYWSGSGFGQAPYPEAGLGQAIASVSFALPLSEAPSTHYIKEEETDPQGCTGNAKEPGAEPGNLCVFGESEVNVGTEGGAQVHFIESGPIGFTVGGYTAAPGRIVLDGSWAVTAK